MSSDSDPLEVRWSDERSSSDVSSGLSAEGFSNYQLCIPGGSGDDNIIPCLVCRIRMESVSSLIESINLIKAYEQNNNE